MFKFVAMWNIRPGLPKSEFEEWYTERHIPDAKHIPGLVKYTVNRVSDAARDNSRYYRMAELCFSREIPSTGLSRRRNGRTPSRTRRVTSPITCGCSSFRRRAIGWSCMTQARFPELEWFTGYSAYVETDEDFRRHGRWFVASIAFRVDQEVVTVAFDRGLALKVEQGLGEHDFLISGSRAQWDYLFQKQWGLVRLYRSQTLQVRGDPVRRMKEWKPIFFIVEAMKRFEQSR